MAKWPTLNSPAGCATCTQKAVSQGADHSWVVKPLLGVNENFIERIELRLVVVDGLKFCANRMRVSSRLVFTQPGIRINFDSIKAHGQHALTICLGHQIVARAAGAETKRLAFGHHGANHPVRDLPSGRVYVTAQNHEVEVVGGTLPIDSGFEVSQINLNDGSVEGLRHRDLPIETVQYHPEGSPGPLDATPVFDRFMTAIAQSER